jgi:hypothetical protein
MVVSLIWRRAAQASRIYHGGASREIAEVPR